MNLRPVAVESSGAVVLIDDVTYATKGETPVFKPGDVVQLKSGGPAMTVSLLTEYERSPTTLTCIWFTGDDVKVVELLPQTLKPVETQL